MDLGIYTKQLAGYKYELSNIKPLATLIDVSKLEIRNQLYIFITYLENGKEEVFRFKSWRQFVYLRNPCELSGVLKEFENMSRNN
jgi:hypothetical protein